MKSLNGCRGPFLDKQKAFEYIDFALFEGPDLRGAEVVELVDAQRSGRCEP